MVKKAAPASTKRTDLRNVIPVTAYLTPAQVEKLKQIAEELTQRRRDKGEIESVSVAAILRRLVEKYSDLVKEHF